MKSTEVKIKVTGQSSGNRKILNVLNSQSTPESLPFNNWVIDYTSMGEAKKALKDAHKYLEGSYLISSTRLRYDASVAEIIEVSEIS